MKLVIGIPTNGEIKSATVACLVPAIFKTPLEMIELAIPSTCLVHINRNTIVEIALEEEVDHVMFIDSDMIFPDDGIKILASKDKDIIGANYNVRGKLPLYRTVNYKYKDLPKEPFICDGVASGFMLVKTSVFRKIDPPWFFFKHLGGNAFLGEDYWFCEKARKAGYDIWCDPTIKIEHIGDYRY